LTRSDLAERAGLHYVSLGRIENGEENVTVLTLSKIARALGVTLSDLLGLDQGNNPTGVDLNGEADGLKRLGRRISELREQRRWSQRELARRTGFHYVTICRIEKGQRNIAFLDALRIAEALEIGVGELLGVKLS